EINVALSFKYIKTEDVLEMLKNKSKSTELVLTGRGAPEEIRAEADYVTVLQREKHPFDRGVMGRWGVEY
ncbi:MAG: cob(I)yrinic acid a,c-diamide adenosyltransferase, partial [archaeon]|nr:cob(I)yrinic acid a,c-diamide adenosyltransferase [archaeon]